MMIWPLPRLLRITTKCVDGWWGLFNLPCEEIESDPVVYLQRCTKTEIENTPNCQRQGRLIGVKGTKNVGYDVQCSYLADPMMLQVI
jgi:hypothetical protein